MSFAPCLTALELAAAINLAAATWSSILRQKSPEVAFNLVGSSDTLRDALTATLTPVNARDGANATSSLMACDIDRQDATGIRLTTYHYG
jgi:hypothetical protein